MQMEKYDPNYYPKTLKSNFKKAICLASFIIASRKFLISSFIYKRVYEKWGFYLFSYEKQFFTQNSLILKFNKKTPYASYCSAVVLYYLYNILISISLYEIKNKYNVFEKDGIFYDGLKNGISLFGFSLIFYKVSLPINVGFSILGFGATNYSRTLKNNIKNYF